MFDASIVLLFVGLIAMAYASMRKRDRIPMTVNLILIMAGTAAMVWAMTHKADAMALRDSLMAWLDQTVIQIALLVAAQPVVYLFAMWLSKKLWPGNSQSAKGQ